MRIDADEKNDAVLINLSINALPLKTIYLVFQSVF
jgi:hypothetical protein